MSSLGDKLKLSVSLAALMGVGSLAAGSARGATVTITGTQTFVAITTAVTGDVNVASTGIISPFGMFVSANIGGDLVNDGLIEGILPPPSATSTTLSGPTVGIVLPGLGIGTTVDGSIVNNGTISSDLTLDQEFAVGSGNVSSAVSYGVFAPGIAINVANGGISAPAPLSP